MKSLTTYLLLFVLSVGYIHEIHAQCTNASAYGSATASLTAGTNVTISSCNYQTEYSTISNVQSGYTYQATNGSGGYVTVRSGSSSGAVVAHGLSPLTWTATTTGTHYIHWNTDPLCGTATSCTSTSITTVSSAPVSCHTTGITADGISVTIDMNDSYGDGWDGASLAVCQDGTITTHTISSGSTNQVNLTLAAGETYAITYNSGSFESEHSYIVRVDGVQVYSSGTSPTTGDILHGSYVGVSCNVPSGLSSSILSTSSANISWSAPTPAPDQGYEVYYSASATAPTSGTSPSTTVAAGVLSKTLTGLSMNTPYYYWVRSNCNGTDKSNWAGGSSFTILEGQDCNLVQDLAGLTSPYSGTTVGYANSFSTSVNAGLTGTAGDRIFKLDVPTGYRLFIGQSTNGYDSKHRFAVGGACPGTTEINTGYVANLPTQTTTGTINGYLDDNDLTHYYYQNTSGSTQTVYWLQDCFSSSEGTFTLEWLLVAIPPSVTASVGSLSDFSACASTASSEQSFTVSGEFLDGNLVVSPPAGFEISLTSGAGFSSSNIVLTPSGGSVASTTIYARMASQGTAPASSNITCVSTTASQNVSVSGSIIPGPTSVSAGADDSNCPGIATLLGGSATAPIVSGQVVYSDDFSSNTGWILNGSWSVEPASASSGCSGSQDPASDNSPSGDNGILGYAIGACYETNMAETYAESPIIDLSGTSNVNLNFYRWLGVESSSFDHASIDVFDGASWVTIYDHTAGSFSDAAWTLMTYDISAYVNANFQIRFIMGTSDGSVQYCGWNIDDLTITADQTAQVTYAWSPTTALSASNLANPSATPSYNTTYTMTATANGCSVSDEVVISVDQPNTTTIDADVTANDSYVWSGATSSACGIASNWYKFDGTNWVVPVSAPGASDKVFVLDDAGQTCIAANDPAGEGTISHLYVKSGANLSLGGALTVNDFNNEGTVSLSTNTLNVKGDYNDQGTFNYDTGKLAVNGAAPQTLTGTNMYFYDLEINNSTGVTLAGPVKVDRGLTLTNGHLILNDNDVIIRNGATINGTPSSSKMIVAAGTGTLKKEFNAASSFTFPVGTTAGGNEYTPVTLTFNAGTFGAGANVAVKVTDVKNSQMNSNVDTYINRTWSVEPTNISGYDYDIELSYVDNDVVEGTYTEGDMAPVKFSGGEWYQADGVNSVFTNAINQGFGFINAFSNVLSWGGLSTFSEFGGAGGSNQPLPVELTSFNGACDNGVISLAWETASENNSSHFDVEKSRDGENWTVLSTIAAAGTSNEIISYQAVDHSATDGNNYFRLRQVDIDGTEKLYDPINVSCEAISVGYFSSYPNPSGNAFQIIVNNEDLVGECVLNMVDAQGKVIERRAIEVKPGINMFVMNQNLKPGMYFLNVSNGSNSTPVIRHSIK